jgi:hypothetical protein
MNYFVKMLCVLVIVGFNIFMIFNLLLRSLKILKEDIMMHFHSLPFCVATIQMHLCFII